MVRIKFPLANLMTVLGVALAYGCSQTAISPQASSPAMPSTWQRGGEPGELQNTWLQVFDNPELSELVAESVENNFALQQTRARLRQAEQSVVVARAGRLPSLDLTVDSRRQGASDSDTSESFGAGVDARWDVDLWGRLNKRQQAAQLDYAAQQAGLMSEQRVLAATTATTYFQVLESRQLLNVAKRRLENAQESADIVASGYRQGLNDALDLYLAKNQVEREKANYALQQQLVAESGADLQLLLARYPDGDPKLSQSLPFITDDIPAGLPSQLLTRRADVQQAWFNLLAADAELAAAHKSRFPSLSLVGSSGSASDEFSQLLDGGNTVWSVAAGLTQPLFDARRLGAVEAQALAEVQRVEQQYLDLVYRAFADVENAISRSASLRARYDSLLEAEKNSAAALQLALQQYQRGLVSYTTVLESQRQAFDAESTVVQLKSQLLQNRINLYLALGGGYSLEN